jgi:hypothetical protein
MKRIEELNDAYLMIRTALKVIKFQSKGQDADTYFYRIEKAMSELHKLILKDLKDELIDDEFDKIVKKFKR